MCSTPSIKTTDLESMKFEVFMKWPCFKFKLVHAHFCKTSLFKGRRFFPYFITVKLTIRNVKNAANHHLLLSSLNSHRTLLVAHRRWTSSFGLAMILRRLSVCCSPDGRGLMMNPIGLFRSGSSMHTSGSCCKCLQLRVKQATSWLAGQVWILPWWLREAVLARSES